MNRKFSTSLSIIFCLGAVMLCSAIAGAETIVVAVDPELPPMESLGQGRNLVGFDIDLMKAVAAAGGFTAQFKETGWFEIFNGLEEGKYDAIISSVTITEERKKTFDFSLPYVKCDEVLLVNASDAGIRGFADLSGKTVGTLSGAPPLIAALYELRDQHGIKAKLYTSLDQGLADLSDKTISGFVYDSIFLRNILQTPDYKGKLKILGRPLAEGFYGIVVKKGNTKVLKLINGGLKKVLDSGKNVQIERIWLK